jgi:plasmid maintenance system killer protein
MIRSVASAAAPVGLFVRKRRPRIVSERIPCECQRHRQERKRVARCTRCFRTRRRSENWPVMLFCDILVRLDASATVANMDLPGFRPHPLKGEMKGFWAVNVRGNWRVIFRFADGDAFDVDYLDYH